MHAHARNSAYGGRHAKPKPDSGLRRRHAVGGIVLAIIATLAFGAPVAQAIDGEHAAVEIDHDRSGCGTVEFETAWSENASNPQDNAHLVVQPSSGEVATASIGEPLSVGPFDELTAVYYRVFGGGERDYDVPLWNGHPNISGNTNSEFKEKVTKYAADNGGWSWTISGLDDPNPFTKWKEVRVNGCVEPGPVEFTHPICEDLGSAVVPEVKGVNYDGESQELEHGDTVEEISAQPKEGYEFPAGAETSWGPFTAIRNPCDGSDGTDGSDGSDGEDGEDGTDGQDGEDGETTIVLPTRINTGR